MNGMCGINDCFTPSGLKYFLQDPQGVALGYHIMSLWDFANADYYRVNVPAAPGKTARACPAMQNYLLSNLKTIEDQSYMHAIINYIFETGQIKK